ncbi:AMP-binding protein [Parachlamydia sp. AcF125]|uniref:class I adenylate-forming enzyme family protein n=1 Tax=Parachlamydia sp. AcF125 TaxID=2795736 RepID=UPI001BC9CF71|nr:AMP-binding protein [Parachlamydia sp. AcF125]MBS4169083.1 Surfactin synthase subunit 2 [Parachlamydia sp. AcF125]
MTSDFLFLPDQTVSLKTFEENVLKHKALFSHHSTILVRTSNILSLFASIIAARELQISLYLSPLVIRETQIERLLHEWPVSLYLSEDNSIEFSRPETETPAPHLGIFTSGTLGEPKIALHRWDAIQAPSHLVPSYLYQKTWLLSYAPWSYAGLQVFFSALNSQGSLYYDDHHFEKIAKGMLEHQVSIISATPTFWRMLIAAWPPLIKPPKLLQATLGGEIVDQQTIDLIGAFFHPQRLTHIYASTEAGSAIVVSDRDAGFPLSFLNQNEKKGALLRITEENELEVLAPQGMDGYLNTSSVHDQWIPTGDLVEIERDRVYFVGRKDGRINSGGRKISPEEVEQAINSLKDVEDSLVYARKSPIVGSLIVADVKMRSSKKFDSPAIKQELRKILEEYKIPHLIRRVDHFAISSNGKKIRGFL